MQDHVGGVYEGVITAVTSFGLFVELKGVFVEGLLHITALDKDYYHFDPVGHRLIGERSGQVYRLGDTVTIQVARVDLDERKIDFVLPRGESVPAPVDEDEADHEGGEGGAAKKKRRRRKKPKTKSDQAVAFDETDDVVDDNIGNRIEDAPVEEAEAEELDEVNGNAIDYVPAADDKSRKRRRRPPRRKKAE